MPRLTQWPSARPATEIAGRSSPNNRAKGSVACARRPPTPDPSAADSTGALSAPPPAPSAPGFGIPEFFSLFRPVLGPLGLMMLLDFDWNHIDRDLNHKKDVSNKCDCAHSRHLNEEPSSCYEQTILSYDAGTPGRRVQLPYSDLSLPCTKYQPFQHAQTKLGARRLRSGALICAAALSARCAAEQTQTVTRQSSTITIAPIQGKEKSPELDDGGTGFPPRDDDGGGGGGGGGGGHWSGGFFFFGLLAFLGLMKDQESEGPYQNNKRRY
ncbi:unnamed protein product [Musa acuminata subsp. burmannicoides]